MVKGFLEKKLKQLKSEFAFERQHIDYFKKLYLNVLVLMFLTAVLVLFFANLHICTSWDGYLTLKNGSFFAYECVGNLTPASPIYDLSVIGNASDLYIP